MKPLAVVGISSNLETEIKAKALYTDVSKCVEDWIKKKGKAIGQRDGLIILDIGQGRTATMYSDQHQLNTGQSQKVVIREPTVHVDGIFQTTVHIAISDHQVDVVCMLDVENPNNLLLPVNPVASLPKVIRDIISLPGQWAVSGYPVDSKSTRYLGDAAGQSLAALINNAARTLPIVVVSMTHGKEAVPKLAESLAKDLMGLANVALVDEQASWQLTQELGRYYACYGGAIRLYWPIPFGTDGSSVRHPRWRREEVILLHKDMRGSGIRGRLKDLILHISTFRPHFSSVIKKLKVEREEKERQLALSAAGSDRELADIFSKENDVLKGQVAELRTKIENLELLLAVEKQTSASLSEKLKEHEQVETSAGTIVRVREVAEAVAFAKTNAGDTLIFGGDVGKGVVSVAPIAGPPARIFHALSKLSELSGILRRGELKGSNLLGWLSSQNIACSGESQTIKNSRAEMQNRTWDAGGKKMEFENHIKVNEGTDPGNCVRIYFHWDKSRKQMIVGWVGRHP
ncbi:MAG: hypothetical protein HY079_10300 [Elusimicrobia bacterium]|nr:hypothetical protein [Elusimicrobiota bacterium]